MKLGLLPIPASGLLRLPSGKDMSEELKRGIPKAIVTGYIESTAEDREKADADFEKILKQYGVMKENQSIKDWKHPK